ncbi:hypothetical protein [Rhizobium sp. LC145]|uniref:hypothetical protein n=1 Tax=Rhizobium sp. LC145 TaxID=1120688 RepID=UPI00062A194A|nr:hypothetical protein [Rhizobium sp. LC145]KKX25403.1 hypothetical protein YH62_26105 [Rhizobium sp. LC145]
MSEAERPRKLVSLRDVPEEIIEIACTQCDFRQDLSKAEVLKTSSPDVLLEVLVMNATKDCEHRRAFGSQPPCGAYTDQVRSAEAAILERRESERREREEAARRRAEEEERRAERVRNAAIRVGDNNGWMGWQKIPTGSKPRYRWQHSWAEEEPEDFIGLDGTQPIGRVFQLETVSTSKDIWFWILYGVEGHRRKRPGKGSGWEGSRLDAMCRVEQLYEEMNSKRYA